MQRSRIRNMMALVLMVAVIAGCTSPQDQAFQSVEGKAHSAVMPEEQTVEWAAQWWMPRHEAVTARIAQGNVDVLFIGDSITHGWENTGREVWDEYYADRNAANMGFSGDRTQHVLWRIDHTDFSTISPKLAIIMIGTNNSNGDDNTAEEIADGIIKICKQLRAELPATKLLLLATFPRSEQPDAQRQKNATASELASRIADGDIIRYLDIGDEFLDDDGTLPADIMPDFLHPNLKGYRIWAEAMESTVANLLGE